MSQTPAAEPAKNESLLDAAQVLAALSEDEIRRLNTELQQKVSALTAANAELERFNYSIAHDLRAPLRSMNSFANALLEDEGPRLSEKGAECAGHIVRSAKYLDTLLQDLLAYGSLLKTQMRTEEVSLEAEIRETASLFAGEIARCGVDLQICSPIGTVCAHSPAVRQVLNNLLDNALKFCSPNRPPVIRFYSMPRDSFLRLWVEDNGIGIAPEHHERIFAIFRRLHPVEKYPGTGIGLAIVRRAAEQMGGRAGVESTLGKGSRFWIELPAAPSPL